MRNENGHSLVEAMVGLLISGIILATTLPSFSSLLEKNQQTQTTNQLIGALHYARNTAVLKRATVSLCAGIDICIETNNWHDHILIFIDHNQDGKLGSEDERLQQLKLADGYSWHWSNFRNRTYYQFAANGRTRALNGTFSLCREKSSSRQIVINVTGRVRTQTKPAQLSCR